MKKLSLLIIALALIGCQKCKRGHVERVHHPAWVQMITTSIKPLIMVPITHPAYDANEFMCDEYCQKGDTSKECK